MGPFKFAKLFPTFCSNFPQESKKMLKNRVTIYPHFLQWLPLFVTGKLFLEVHYTQICKKMASIISSQQKSKGQKKYFVFAVGMWWCILTEKLTQNIFPQLGRKKWAAIKKVPRFTCPCHCMYGQGCHSFHISTQPDKWEKTSRATEWYFFTSCKPLLALIMTPLALCLLHQYRVCMAVYSTFQIMFLKTAILGPRCWVCERVWPPPPPECTYEWHGAGFVVLSSAKCLVVFAIVPSTERYCFNGWQPWSGHPTPLMRLLSLTGCNFGNFTDGSTQEGMLLFEQLSMSFEQE